LQLGVIDFLIISFLIISIISVKIHFMKEFKVIINKILDIFKYINI